jgi:phosphotriesterase-related protein
MATFANEGKVMTVEGPVQPEDLGVTLSHEHLLIDRSSAPECGNEPMNDRARELLERPFSIEHLGEARRDGGLFLENVVLDDAELALEEISEFKKLGGETIADVSTVGFRVDARRIRDLARKAGLKVIVASGYYTKPTHPPELAEKTVDEITEEFLREADQGLDGSGIRPGLIGEIGISQPGHADEWKVLIAACRAQKETGLPLMIHPFFGDTSRMAPEIVRRVVREGVEPDRVNICHMDGFMNLDYQRRILDTGVFISFDTCGLEAYYDSLGYNFNTHDSLRERHLIELINMGYVNQIMISQDVCLKMQLQRYGGYGYAHILRHMVPSLRYKGIGEDLIRQLLVENPKRYFTIF